jgi:hypothetical protein
MGGKPEFDVFLEGFVAALVSRGITSINPNAPETVEALRRVCAALDQRAEKTSEASKKRWLNGLISQVQPGNIGTFDYFFAALRGKQLGFVASPNPRYRELSFRISPTYARHYLDQLGPDLKEVLEVAANSYLKVSNS